MASGVTTTNISNKSGLLDEILGNRNGSTALTPVDDFAVQLLGSSSFAQLVTSGDTVTKSTWVELSAIAGSRDGQRGYVEDDAGEHIDPVTTGKVRNSGIYTWVAASAAWRWLRREDAAGKQAADVLANLMTGDSIIYTSDDCAPGYLLKVDGTESTTVNGWIRTDFIPVLAGTKLHRVGSTVTVASAAAAFAFYDADEHFLGQYTSGLNNDTMTVGDHFPKARFVRVSNAATIALTLTATESIPVSAIREFSDIATPAINDVLAFNGESWKNRTLPSLLMAGAPVADPSSSQLVLLDDTGAVTQRLPWNLFITALQDQFNMADTPTYSFDLSTTVSPAATLLVDAVDGSTSIREVYGQVSPDAASRIAIAFGGSTPSIAGAGSITLDPGQTFSISNPPPGAINGIAEAASVPLTLVAVSTQNQSPNIATILANHWSRYTGTYTQGQKNAIKTFYADLYNAGVINAAKDGAIAFFGAANDTDALLNWAGAGTFTLYDAPALGWTGYTFDGVNDAINMGIKASAAGSINNIAMALHSGSSNVVGTAAYAMGDSVLRLTPNRTATGVTVRFFGAAMAVTVNNPSNGLIGITKNSDGKATVFQGQIAEVEIDTTTTEFSARNIFIGATTSTGTPTAFYPGRILFGYVGKALSSDQRTAIDNAISAYLTSAAGF